MMLIGSSMKTLSGGMSIFSIVMPLSKICLTSVVVARVIFKAIGWPWE